jgi:hypothetical protein
MQMYMFYCIAWNLVSHVKGRTQVEGLANGVLRKIFGHKTEEMT